MPIASWTLLVCLGSTLAVRAQDAPGFDVAIVKAAPPGARAGGYRVGPDSLTARAATTN